MRLILLVDYLPCCFFTHHLNLLYFFHLIGTITTKNYYLKVLKNNFEWKEQEELYLLAPTEFLDMQDIDGDNVLHVFTRKHKTGFSTEFLQRLDERLWSQNNVKNTTPFEEAMETDHLDKVLHLENAKVLYDFIAEHKGLNSFRGLLDQMSNISYLINLPCVFHGIAKSGKTKDRMEVGRKSKKYDTMKKKIIELNAMDKTLRRSSVDLRKNTKLLEKIFHLFWDTDEGELIV